jgi:actin-like ATPase involved in cell morphogenesis
MSKTVGIDLGTTNSVVAYPEDIILWEGEIGIATFGVKVPAKIKVGLKQV